MIDETQFKNLTFKQLEKKSAKSFHQHKFIIKKVLAGQTVDCQQCKKPLLWQENKKQAQIACQQGCTHLALEMD